MGHTVLRLERYTNAATGFLVAAQKLADDAHHVEVTALHFLCAVLEADRDKPGVRGIDEVFRRAGSDPVALVQACHAELTKLPKSSGDLAFLTDHLVEMLARAERKADAERYGVIDSRYVLLAFSEDAGIEATELCKREAFDPQRIADHLDAMVEAERKEDEKLFDPARYTPDAFARLMAAQARAAKLQHMFVSSLHLFVELLEWDHGVHERFHRAGADPVAALERARTFLASLRSSPRNTTVKVAAYLTSLLRKAEAEATADAADKVDIEHILHAFAREVPNPPAEILWSAGIRAGSFRPPPEPEEEDLADIARERAASFVSAVKESDDVELDYDRSSLRWLAEQIEIHRLTWSTELAPKAFENLKEAMSYYLGECFVRRMRGQWVWRDDERAVELVGPNGESQFALPFQAVRDQVESNQALNVLLYFASVGLSSGKMDVRPVSRSASSETDS